MSEGNTKIIKKTVTAHFTLSMEQAEELCADLLADLGQRGVIGEVWADIPEMMQLEIRATWAQLLRKRVNHWVRERRVGVRARKAAMTGKEALALATLAAERAQA